MTERKSVLLRLDPAVHDALARWAADELRSTNAQIEFLLRRALADAGRLPGRARPMRPRAGHRPSPRPKPARQRAMTDRYEVRAGPGRRRRGTGHPRLRRAAGRTARRAARAADLP